MRGGSEQIFGRVNFLSARSVKKAIPDDATCLTMSLFAVVELRTRFERDEYLVGFTQLAVFKVRAQLALHCEPRLFVAIDAVRWLRRRQWRSSMFRPDNHERHAPAP